MCVPLILKPHSHHPDHTLGGIARYTCSYPEEAWLECSLHASVSTRLNIFLANQHWFSS